MVGTTAESEQCAEETAATAVEGGGTAASEGSAASETATSSTAIGRGTDAGCYEATAACSVEECQGTASGEARRNVFFHE